MIYLSKSNVVYDNNNLINNDAINSSTKISKIIVETYY